MEGHGDDPRDEQIIQPVRVHLSLLDRWSRLKLWRTQSWQIDIWYCSVSALGPRDQDPPIIPSVGLAESGSVISALIPQTIVVSPILTSADPSAVDIEPELCEPPLAR